MSASLQQDLSQLIHLLWFLKPRGSLVHNKVIELIQPKNIGRDIAAQDPLNFISACLAIESNDRVVVAFARNDAYARSELVIAKAGPTGERDEHRAIAVLSMLREISVSNVKQALLAVMKQDFGQLLFRQQVQKLEDSTSHLASGLKVAVEALQIPDGDLALDSVNQIREYASKLSSATTMNGEDWMALYNLINETLRHPKLPLSHTDYDEFIEFDMALQAFHRWPKAVSSLIDYLKVMNTTSLSYRIIPTPMTMDTVHFEEGPYTLTQFASSTKVLKEYEEFWPKLLKKFELKDQKLSSSVIVHPEVRLILDLQTTTAVVPHIIGTNINPCICCTIWMRYYNTRFGTTWTCGNDYQDLDRDWASPNSYCRHASNRTELKVAEKQLLAQLRRMLREFLLARLEELDDRDNSNSSEDADEDGSTGGGPNTTEMQL